MFRVGQKVVCVDSKLPTHARNRNMDGLTEGAIYTIRATDVWCWVNDRYDGVYLVEIVRAVVPGCEHEPEVPFWKHRFRPVVERKTDISIFTAMLNNAPSKVTERA